MNDLKQRRFWNEFPHPIGRGDIFKNGNGVERAMLFKLVDDDVSTAWADAWRLERYRCV